MASNLEEINSKELEELSPPQATLALDFSAIHVEPENPSIWRGTTSELGDIECQKLSDTTASRRALEAYRDLQYGAYIQAIHGLAKIDGDIFIVMQDCSKLSTLAEECNNNTTSVELIARVRLAFDVAQSIAWLHSADLILKTLNDRAVKLVRGNDGTLRPCITEVEHVRLVGKLVWPVL